MNEDFKDGIKIYSIDKEQEEMIIHLGNLNKFHREYKELKQENQQLKEVIDKAIKYINSKEYQYGDLEQDVYDYDIGFDEVNELLEILKGEENDR